MKLPIIWTQNLKSNSNRDARQSFQKEDRPVKNFLGLNKRRDGL